MREAQGGCRFPLLAQAALLRRRTSRRLWTPVTTEGPPLLGRSPPVFTAEGYGVRPFGIARREFERAIVFAAARVTHVGKTNVATSGHTAISHRHVTM